MSMIGKSFMWLVSCKVSNIKNSLLDSGLKFGTLNA